MKWHRLSSRGRYNHRSKPSHIQLTAYGQNKEECSSVMVLWRGSASLVGWNMFILNSIIHYYKLYTFQKRWDCESSGGAKEESGSTRGMQRWESDGRWGRGQKGVKEASVLVLWVGLLECVNCSNNTAQLILPSFLLPSIHRSILPKQRGRADESRTGGSKEQQETCTELVSYSDELSFNLSNFLK